MIITSPYQYITMSRESTDKGRFYVQPSTSDGNVIHLPSVTTILGNTADHSYLDKWRESVGHDEANRITSEAADIGQQLHSNLENHIFCGTPPTGPLLVKILTNLVITKGLSNVNEVWGCEVPLYSKYLYAGTADLIGVHKTSEAVMDFKNSLRKKTKEEIEDYFLQLVAYIESHNEMYGTKINKGVIMMACRTGNYLEFILEGIELLKYKKMWYDRLYAYYEANGI